MFNYFLFVWISNWTLYVNNTGCGLLIVTTLKLMLRMEESSTALKIAPGPDSLHWNSGGLVACFFRLFFAFFAAHPFVSLFLVFFAFIFLFYSSLILFSLKFFCIFVNSRPKARVWNDKVFSEKSRGNIVVCTYESLSAKKKGDILYTSSNNNRHVVSSIYNKNPPRR